MPAKSLKTDIEAGHNSPGSACTAVTAYLKYCRANRRPDVFALVDNAAMRGDPGITYVGRLNEAVVDELRSRGFDVTDFSTVGQVRYEIWWA